MLLTSMLRIKWVFKFWYHVIMDRKYYVQDSNTALLKACLGHHWNIVKFLLEQKDINVNRSDKSGTTPLFAVVSSNNLEITQLLLLKNARVNSIRVCIYLQLAMHACSKICVYFIIGCYKWTYNGACWRDSACSCLCSWIPTDCSVTYCCQCWDQLQVCGRWLKIIDQVIIRRDLFMDVNRVYAIFIRLQDTVPPIGFAIICRQTHVVHYLLNHPLLDKSIQGLSSPICISVKVENYECTKLLLGMLGGAEKGLRLAEESGLPELQQHIHEYIVTAGPEVRV